jgi:Trk-type K+ transport system membrane component
VKINFRTFRLPSLSASAFTATSRVLDLVLVACGFAVLALFVLMLGWPLPEEAHVEIARFTRGLLFVFAGQELLRLLLAPRRLTHALARKLEVLLALAASLELFFGNWVVAWLQTLATGLSPTAITLLYLGGAQLTLVASVILRGLRSINWLNARHLSPGLVFILSFTLLIAIGTLLLKVPHATHQGLGWVDALFLSASAVCVTGLSPVDISTTLTMHGQGVLLGLIQAGGLGVMTLTYFFAYFMAGGLSLRSRIGLQDLLSEENLGQIGTVLGLIIGFTFGIELVGAYLLHTSLVNSGVQIENLPFFALFHSISAFCNAGFSTLGAGLADPRIAPNYGVLSVIMGLIVLGGLGFPVLKNFWQYLVARIRRKLGLRIATPPRLTANSRIVLWTTALLLVGGTVMIWFTEFVFGTGQSNGSTWFTALFHSVTARTAGFNITPVEALMPASCALIMLLMFIGGSPSSTAGGIKTSTVAIACLSLRRVIFGRRDIEAFDRRFNDELANRALSIVLLAVGFITLVTVTLCTLHPELPPADLTFEAVSAVGTVGLSRGITSQLGEPAKLVLVFAMLVGRVGVLAFILALVPRRPSPPCRLPETGIVLC